MMADNGRPPSDTVTLSIDGRDVTVPKGTSLLEAAASMGTDLPHYCWHPGLSAPAQCRICLVEVEGAPKLQPSCVTTAQDGQVVRTDSAEALKMREGVLEFYLVNHPLDCPVCDMSGECKLQDYVFAEGREKGRGREPKRVFGRDDFGGDVLYYGDRCVMCTRCVRFMDEVARDSRLTVVERGSRAVIDTFFAEGLEGASFAGNVVDICPVGALVSKDFLHKARAWDLDHTPSVCPGCSQGCNIELHVRDNLVQRLKPRENPEVNGHWMCDYGRARYEWMNQGGRLAAPATGRSGERRPAAWDEALGLLLARLRAADGADVKVVGSAGSSCEALAALAAVAEAAGSVSARAFRSRRAATEDVLPGFPLLARRRDLSPNAGGAQALSFSRVGGDDGTGGLEDVAAHDGVVLVMDDDLADQDETFAAAASLFVYLGTREPPKAAANADFVLPLATFAEQEGAFVNVQGRVQRFWPGLRTPGESRPAWLVLGALLAALEGGDAAPDSCAQAFAEIVAARHEAFAGLSYGRLGTQGAMLASAASSAAGRTAAGASIGADSA